MVHEIDQTGTVVSGSVPDIPWMGKRKPVPNALVEVPEPGILFTRDNATWAYHALKAVRDAGQSIPEQDELLDELQRILWPPPSIG